MNKLTLRQISVEEFKGLKKKGFYDTTKDLL